MKFSKAFIVILILFIPLVSISANEMWTTYTTGIYETDYIRDMAIYGNELWCATAGGIVYWSLSDMQHYTFTIDEELPSNLIDKIAVENESAVWFIFQKEVGSQEKGLSKIDSEGVTTIPGSDILSGKYIFSMAVDSHGRIWIGTVDNGLICYDGVDTWTAYSTENSFASNTIFSIAVGSDDMVWFGTENGVIRYDSDGNWTTFTTENGIANNRVCSLAVDIDGVVWALAPGGGVSRYEGGENWTALNEDYTSELELMSKLSEPKTILQMIVILEKTYYLSNNEYIDFNYGENCVEIGYAVPINVNFEYSFIDSVAYAREIADVNGDGDIADGLTLTISDIQDILPDSDITWLTGSSLIYHNLNSLAANTKELLWSGTREGASMFDGKSWTTYTSDNGLAEGFVFKMVFTSDGILWAGCEGGLSRLNIVPTIVETGNMFNKEFALIDNFPNPFNPETTISFTISGDGMAFLDIYNIMGQHIRSLISGSMTTGIHTVKWDGRNDQGHRVSSGVYFARLKEGLNVASHRMLLVR